MHLENLFSVNVAQIFNVSVSAEIVASCANFLLLILLLLLLYRLWLQLCRAALYRRFEIGGTPASSLVWDSLIALVLILPAVFVGNAADFPSQTSQTTNGASSTALASAIADREYQKLLLDDDVAQAEVNKWLQDYDASKAKGAAPPAADLERRIRERLEPVRKAYESFLSAHPLHPGAHLAYGNFLNDRQDEPGAQTHWERALELDPKNADAYNNLAGRYSESGLPRKAFQYFTKAIELKPAEAIYYHNFANSLYVLSKPAMQYYGLNQEQVYLKTLQLYSNAAWLEPKSFTFATDWAQTYYSLKPFLGTEALKAWTNALKSAQNELQREDVYVHLARVKMLTGQLAEARKQLEAVTNENSLQLKTNLLRRIEEREHTSGTTNPAAVLGPPRP